MGFRTVIIKNRAKLEVRLNSLIVRGEQEKKVFLDEINTLIVQSTAVSLTASLLCELMRRNIKVIFCDEKHNPQSELLPYYGEHNTSKRYKEQIVSASKYGAMISDLFHFDLNDKKLLNLLYKRLKSVLSDEKLQQVYKHCQSEQVGLLLIEDGKRRNLLSCEKAVIITEDLCEILENYK